MASPPRGNPPAIEPEYQPIASPLSEQAQPQPEALLAALGDVSSPRDQISHTVLEAELVRFTASQVSRLQPLLRGYIERNRDSNDPAEFVAVASAIRQYAANLGRDELPAIGFVLQEGDKAVVAPAIELEVAKMVVRKLTANLPEQADAMPGLSDQLIDLSRTYLNERFLPGQYYAATALNSLLALVLLRSAHRESLFGILRGLPVSWFKQLVARRARSVAQELAVRYPGDASRAHREALECLVQIVQEAGD